MDVDSVDFEDGGGKIFECGELCQCDLRQCQNRVCQRGCQFMVEIFYSKGKGWGVKAVHNIPKGAFMGLYVGEIIADEETKRRQDNDTYSSLRVELIFLLRFFEKWIKWCGLVNVFFEKIRRWSKIKFVGFEIKLTSNKFNSNSIQIHRLFLYLFCPKIDKISTKTKNISQRTSLLRPWLANGRKRVSSKTHLRR